MGRRRPRPPRLEAPLSASSVEMMDFTRIQFNVPHQSSKGDPRVSYTGDNFASMSSVLNKLLFQGDAKQP